MGIVQLLSLIVHGIFLVGKAIGNLGRLLGWYCRMALFWVAVWGLIIAAFIVPKTWWKNAASNALEWATARVEDATGLLDQLQLDRLAIYWEALGEPFRFASWIFDLPFAFNILVTLSGLWLLAFAIKIVQKWDSGKAKT